MKMSRKTLINTTLLLVISSYMLVLWWDVRKVDRFCQAIQPGLKIEYLAEMAKEHGVSLQNLAGISSGKTKAVIYAMASMSGGDRICSIEHDYEYVVETRLLK